MSGSTFMPKIATRQPAKLFENAIKISCRLVNGTPFFYEAASGRAIGGIIKEGMEIELDGALKGKIEFYIEVDPKCLAHKD